MINQDFINKYFVYIVFKKISNRGKHMNIIFSNSQARWAGMYQPPTHLKTSALGQLTSAIAQLSKDGTDTIALQCNSTTFQWMDLESLKQYHHSLRNPLPLRNFLSTGFTLFGFHLATYKISKYRLTLSLGSSQSFRNFLSIGSIFIRFHLITWEFSKYRLTATQKFSKYRFHPL